MTDTRTVLVQCGDHWDNQRRVLPLAAGLVRRGWHPVVMTYAGHQGTLFLRHGIDVAPLNLRRRLRSRDGWAALAMLAGRGRFYRGVDVADVARIERAREPGRLAGTRAQIGWRLRLARRIDALVEVLDETRPARVFVWNGLTGVVALSLRQLCDHRWIPQAFLERGLLPESVFVDPEGTNGMSQLHRLPLERLPDPERDAGASAETSRRANDLRRRHGVDAARLVFVPLQVERDTNILFHSDEIRSMRQLVASVSDALHGQDALVVVRRHPEEIETRLGLPHRDNVRYIDDGPVEEWCDAADLVVTVNSTVGLTALLRGKPVVALGRAIYTNKSLCREPRVCELRAALGDPGTYVPPDRERVERFRRVLLGRHTVTTDHVPDLVPLADDGALRAGGPFNPHGIEPRRFQELWQQAFDRATEAARAGGAIGVRPQLRRDDTLALTYRRQREPVDPHRLRSRIGALLGTPVTHGTAGGVPNVVIAPQWRGPRVDAGTVLVVDPHLEPHAAWLTRTFRG